MFLRSCPRPVESYREKGREMGPQKELGPSRNCPVCRSLPKPRGLPIPPSNTRKTEDGQPPFPQLPTSRRFHQVLLLTQVCGALSHKQLLLIEAWREAASVPLGPALSGNKQEDSHTFQMGTLRHSLGEARHRHSQG